MEPDRFFIDSKVRTILDKMKKLNYLTFHSNKEIFFYAAALGINAPTNISGAKEGFFLSKDLNIEDESRIYSLAITELENIDDITNKKEIYDIVQKMANTGFQIIEDHICNGNIENIEKNLLIELDEKYEELLK